MRTLLDRLAALATTGLAILAVLATPACSKDHPPQTQPLPDCATLRLRLPVAAPRGAAEMFPDRGPTPDVPPTWVSCSLTGLATDGSTPVQVLIDLILPNHYTSPGPFGQEALQQAKGDCSMGTWSTTDTPVTTGRCYTKSDHGEAEQTTVDGSVVIKVHIDVDTLEPASTHAAEANQVMLQDQAQRITDAIAAML